MLLIPGVNNSGENNFNHNILNDEDKLPSIISEDNIRGERNHNFIEKEKGTQSRINLIVENFIIDLLNKRRKSSHMIIQSFFLGIKRICFSKFTHDI